MLRRFSFCLVLLSATAAMADTAAISFGGFGGGGFNYTQGTYLAGFEFRVQAAISVTQLGFYDASSNGQPQTFQNAPVGLWDITTNTLLGSVTVTAADPLTGFFRYAALSTPIALNTTDTYAVAGITGTNYYTAGVPPNSSSVVVNAPVVYLAPALESSGESTTLHEPDYFPTAYGFFADFGSNFQFTTANPTGIIAIGSPLTWSGTNAPDTFTVNTTFSSTPVTVDNGAVSIWQQQVPTGSNGEWDIFYMKTTNGGPLAGNINAYWSISIDFTFTAPVYSDGVVTQWMVNGTPVSPITNGIGSICCAETSNPILPGPAYFDKGNGPEPAGLYTNWQEIYVQPYSLVSNGGIDPSAANEFVFALHFTLQEMPVITSVISASQFGAFPTFGSGSWIEIYGTNLGDYTQEWAISNFNGLIAPMTVGGTSVTVAGQPAFVYYVSPTQLNVQVAGGLGTGSQSVIVTTEAGSSAPFSVTMDAVQPGLLAPSTFDIGGTQYAVALFSDGVTYVLPPGAISGVASQLAKPGDTITLYGIGFGEVNQGIPPGQIAQGQTSLAAPFAVSIGGMPATVTYAGLAPTYVGLYQFDVVVPSVGASNSAPVTFTLGGVSGTQKLFLAIGN